jgi:3-hydroxy-9,10-secoandrosta-1,3,5(10)-triene-9,17-dione monooxygenase
VWGETPDATVASSFLNRSPRIERARGGIRLSGRWEFSSGVDYCDWVMALVRVPDANGGPPVAYFALVPLSDCRIQDCWNATGLAGTGSNDLMLEDVFVPDHRLGNMRDMCDGNGPGTAVNDGYLYRLPQMAVFSFNLVGTVIGAAKGALETVVDQIGDKRSVTQARVAALQSVQLRVAESLADIDAAFALVDRNRHEIIRWGEAGDIPALEQRARYRRDNGYAAMICCRAIDRVMPITGAGGLTADSPVNRAWRDAHAVACHIALTWDLQGAIHGSVALGQNCTDPFV